VSCSAGRHRSAVHASPIPLYGLALPIAWSDDCPGDPGSAQIGHAAAGRRRGASLGCPARVCAACLARYTRKPLALLMCRHAKSGEFSFWATLARYPKGASDALRSLYRPARRAGSPGKLSFAFISALIIYDTVSFVKNMIKLSTRRGGMAFGQISPSTRRRPDPEMNIVLDRRHSCRGPALFLLPSCLSPPLRSW
jgi:hypothetical protein